MAQASWSRAGVSGIGCVGAGAGAFLTTLALAGMAIAGALIAHEAGHAGALMQTITGREAAAGRSRIEQIRAGDPTLPDIQVGIYGGGSETLDNAIALEQPNGTNLLLRNVGWSSRPRHMPPYHGFRGTWWSARLPALGVMGDLTYIKAIARKDRRVEQSGKRDGADVPAREPLSVTFRRLEFTDGLNLLTINGVLRTAPLLDRIRPYFGLGVGLSIPHVEVRRANAATRTFGFQLAGVAFQLIAGIEWRLRPRDRFSAFSEFKLNYATVKADLKGGGTLATNLWTKQLVIGGSAHLRRPDLIALK